MNRYSTCASPRRLTLLTLLMPGLSLAQTAPANPPPAQAQPDRTPAAKTLDRTAILAMRGEYIVDFDFKETVALQAGYVRKPAKRSGGNEVVIVIEDTPDKIVLQHILVSDDGAHVTKHWRQDWTYAAQRRFEFSGDQTWTVRAIADDITRGAWTQCV